MTGTDIFKGKTASSLSRLSKMDVLAQKQNRIAEKKLNAAITTIDKERAVFKVNHRSLVQELRWELKDVRSSTGHSEQGRPPTSEELQRMKTWMPSRQSRGSHAQPFSSRTRGAPGALVASFRGLPPLTEARDGDGGTPADMDSDSDSDDEERARGDDEDRRQRSACERTSAAPIRVGSAQRRVSATSRGESASAPSTSADGRESAPAAAAPATAAGESEAPENSADEALVAGKLEEMKRIMNMPTIYQTQELQKQRGLPRHVVSLPPIKFFDDDDANDNVAPAESSALPKSDERPARTLPELAPASHAAKMPAVSASAELLAEVRKANAHGPLTKATSVGTVFKPDNMRLVGRSFTKAELTAQHRTLLDQNRSEHDINPAKVQMTRLQSRVDAFLSLVSVPPLGSHNRGGPAGDGGKAQVPLPPVSAVAVSGTAAGLKVGQKTKGSS